MINHFFAWKIRSHLLMLVLVAILPAFILIIYNGSERRQIELDQAKDNAQQVAQTIADEQSNAIDDARQLLMTITKIPEVQKQDSAACDKLLKDLLKQNPKYLNFLIADSRGIVFSSALPFTSINISDRKYFRDVLKTKAFAVGDYTVGRISKQKTFNLGYPVLDTQGHVQAVLAVSFALERYGQFFSSEKLPKGSNLIIGDKTGKILYDYPDSANYIGMNDLPIMVTKMTGPHEKGTFVATGSDKIKRLYGFTRLQISQPSPTYQYIRVGIPETIALADAQAITIRNVLFLILSIIFAFILAWFFGDFIIIQRLNKLLSAANRLEQGNLNARTDLPYTQNELGQMAKAFDEMGSALERREMDRIHAEETLRKSEERLQLLIQQMPAMLWTIDLELRFTSLLGAALTKVNLRPKHVLGMTLAAFYQNTDPDYYPIVAHQKALSGESVNYEQEYNGRIFETHLEPLRDPFDQIIGVLGIGFDITERKLAQLNLDKEKELLNVTIHSIGDAVIATDLEGKITLLNKVARQLTGWNLREAFGKPLNEVFKIINEKTREPRENPVTKVFKTGKTVELANHTALIAKNGMERIIADSAAPIRDKDGNLFGVVLVFRDVTNEKTKEKEIVYLGYHDNLTGLYNRAFFEEELKRLQRTRSLPLSLIIGDVNGLKITNDVFGHQEGDRLLQKIAGIIKNAIRGDDILARWGGDEFAVILPNTDEKTATTICDRIMKTCANSEQDPILPSISLGVSTKEKASQDINLVLKEAEDRMYRRKLLESRSTRSALIASFEKTLFEKSFETEEHARRLKKISTAIGREIGLNQNEFDELNLLSLLHDIGKIAISDRILLKPDKLTPEEWIEMQKHPEIGYRIALSINELSGIAEFILSHHERWDGTGYPRQLKGEQIPKLARIIAIVDSYDVMTHARPYKQAMTHQAAIAEIERCAGSQFDPHIARKFIELMQSSEF